MDLTHQHAPVVPCPACDGVTFVLQDCECRLGGDEFFVDWDRSLTGPHVPYRDCELCRGTGTVSRSCSMCDGRGQCRAQLVLTVANVDVGTVASVNVVPGVISPARLDSGQFGIDLGPVIHELAAQVGAHALFDSLPPADPVVPGRDSLNWPRGNSLIWPHPCDTRERVTA